MVFSFELVAREAVFDVVDECRILRLIDKRIFLVVENGFLELWLGRVLLLKDEQH